MEDAACGECSGPLQCEGASKPVALFPCGHLLHNDCAVYTRKSAKLSALPHSCPTCGALVHDVVSLFVSEVTEEVGAADTKECDDAEEPLDVNAMLTRIFHFQRRNLMHQRRVLESKIELKSVQGTLALVHQRKTELESNIGPLSKLVAVNTDCVQNVPQENLLRLILHTCEENAQTSRAVDRIRSLNGVKRRALAELRSAQKKETLSRQSGQQKVYLSPETVFPLPSSVTRVGSKRRHSAVIDVDASSDDEVLCPVGVRNPQNSSVPDVEVITVAKEEHDDEELPPLFPHRVVSSVPQMGASFNRSLRDLPKETDALLQRTLTWRDV